MAVKNMVMLTLKIWCEDDDDDVDDDNDDGE